MTKDGLFIVIEGIDGSGGETQTKKLIEFLKNKGREVVSFSYPNPDSPVGKIIYDYLNKKIELEADVQMALYITDFSLDREKINNALESGKIVIANRYFFSTLAYQCGAKNVPMDDAMQFAKSLNLHVPDIVIYLDITPETSIMRKTGENDELDRHEEDKLLLKKVGETYQKLARDNTFSKEWVVLDGERSIDEVATDVQKIALGKLK